MAELASRLIKPPWVVIAALTERAPPEWSAIDPPLDDSAPEDVSAVAGVDAVETAISPLETRPEIVSAEAALKVTAPSVPLPESVVTALLPVRLTVPAPLRARVAAVIVPVPLNVAPEAVTAFAVPAPTFQEPPI